MLLQGSHTCHATAAGRKDARSACCRRMRTAVSTAHTRMQCWWCWRCCCLSLPCSWHGCAALARSRSGSNGLPPRSPRAHASLVACHHLYLHHHLRLPPFASAAPFAPSQGSCISSGLPPFAPELQQWQAQGTVHSDQCGVFDSGHLDATVCTDNILTLDINHNQQQHRQHINIGH